MPCMRRLESLGLKGTQGDVSNLQDIKISSTPLQRELTGRELLNLGSLIKNNRGTW